MKYIRRAFSDTFKGQLSAIVVLVLGGALSLLYLYITESANVALEEIPYVSGAIFGAFGALFLLFLWNLACSPFRIERAAHRETKLLLPNAPSLPEFIASREFFTLKEAACIRAGQPISHGDLSGPASGYLYDLKKMVLSGRLKPYRINDPAIKASLEFAEMNKFRIRQVPFPDAQMVALGDVEVLKIHLAEHGFIDVSHALQSPQSTAP